MRGSGGGRRRTIVGFEVYAALDLAALVENEAFDVLAGKLFEFSGYYEAFREVYGGVVENEVLLGGGLNGGSGAFGLCFGNADEVELVEKSFLAGGNFDFMALLDNNRLSDFLDAGLWAGGGGPLFGRRAERLFHGRHVGLFGENLKEAGAREGVVKGVVVAEAFKTVMTHERVEFVAGQRAGFAADTERAEVFEAWGLEAVEIDGGLPGMKCQRRHCGPRRRR